MRKTNIIYALLMSTMVSLAVNGCGSNETIDNDMSVESTTPAPTYSVDLGGVVDSDDVTQTTEPTATSTPVPTEAPTLKPTNAFADVEVLGLGTYFDITYPRYEKGQLVEEIITVGFDNVTLKDGRIRYTFQTNWSEHTDFCVTVVDKNTGIEFVEAGTTISPLVCSDPSIILADGTVVEFTITAFSSWDDWELNHTDKMIFVPAEYDDFLFVWKVYDEAGNAVPYKYFGLD